MKPTAFKTATCALVIAVLFVMGSAMSSAVSHELQHATHHSAGSHSKGICAWTCATGAMAGQVSIHLAHTVLVLDSGHISQTSLLRPNLPPDSIHAHLHSSSPKVHDILRVNARPGRFTRAEYCASRL